MRAAVPRPTLRDVAERVGLHQTTVSLALRDHPRIPLATRERIKSAARDLGYRVNPLVAALMRSRRLRTKPHHEVLAYVTNYPTRYGWRPERHDRPDFFPGAERQAELHGYKLEHFWFREPGIGPRRFGEILRARNIRGVLLGRLPPGHASLDFDYAWFSCVALGLTLATPALPRVTEDHFDTVFQAMEQCRARGYRRIGFVFSEANDSPLVGERWLGAYGRQQLEFSAADRLAPFETPAPDAAAFARWFARERPDALVATHAGPVLHWLGALGLAVPADVGLVDLDPQPKLDVAGLRYDPARIGMLAVERLVDMIHRNETGLGLREEVLLKGRWSEGSTLARPVAPAPPRPAAPPPAYAAVE